jgi:segregation and condensation protein B
MNETNLSSELSETYLVSTNTDATVTEVTFSKKVAIVQALLLVNGSSLELAKIKEITKFSAEDILAVVDRLNELSLNPECGFEIVTLQSGNRFQIRTKSEYAEFIQELKAEKPKRLTQPALETLAIIAYKQPLVKSEIEKIRGVDTTPTLKTLIDKNLIKIIGYQDSVGHPALYATTDFFLEAFSLDGLKSLPPLHEVGKIELDPGEEVYLAQQDE